MEIEPSSLRQRIRRVAKRLHRQMKGCPELDEISGMVDKLEAFVREFAQRRADEAAPKKVGRPKTIGEMSKPELLFLAKSKHGAVLSIKSSQQFLAAQVAKLEAEHGMGKEEKVLRAELLSWFDFDAPKGMGVDELKAEFAIREAEAKAAGVTVRQNVVDLVPGATNSEEKPAREASPLAVTEEITDAVKEPTGKWRVFYEHGRSIVVSKLEDAPGWRPGILAPANGPARIEPGERVLHKPGRGAPPPVTRGTEVLAPEPELD